MRKKSAGLVALALGGVLLAGGQIGASALQSPASNTVESGSQATAYSIDDGEELLSQAAISVDEAAAAAQAAGSGEIGEIDLEDFQGQLVFNVDVGSDDIKVDAATGEVLGSDADD